MERRVRDGAHGEAQVVRGENMLVHNIRIGFLSLIVASISCHPAHPWPAADQPDPPAHPQAAVDPPRPRLGMNLGAPVDWSTELPFVDVFRLSRSWVSQRKGARWGQGPELDVDAHGWVRRIEPGCWVDTPLCSIQGGHYPAGEYIVLYDGRGEIEFKMAASIVTKRAGRIVIRVDPRKGGFFLRLVAIDPKDYVRNIRVLMPGHERDYRENPWNPAFLKLWRGVACLRFMDMMKTNNSTIATWKDRPQVEDATFTPKGIPAELLIDLANRLRADPWFCMPHEADDEYMRNFARLVKERLAPGLRAYVEYSNEVWNGGFRQHAYAAEQGKRLGFSEKPWEAAWRYTAHRSSQVLDIWGETLGPERLVRVLASQAANAYVSAQIASFHEAYKHADVLAVAPYLSMLISPNSKPSASEVAGWSADQILDYLETKSLREAEDWMHKSKEVADRYGLKLVAYEGGQHMVGIVGGENDDRLSQLLHTANTSPRIGPIYRKYYDAWAREGGDLFCHFSSVVAWSKWGSWGLLQSLDEDASHSPKFMATMRWARSLNQPVLLP
jgi:hypothetical protein